eukprot:CAMPEP_0204501582 /NCGR_PEP_ID=MMETSP0471-20130131/99510_1 /ASSEMBLY_ACC=CAM_ASM_000602 /TAXON_ID=2969 /ORGANISM="Oxyrrhis marina" /LENGTH=52 /DNA_ID=CAMNT_0051506261 /DNA_START=153 /DNA_END=308 /DNA_ORIENTATION=+
MSRNSSASAMKASSISAGFAVPRNAFVRQGTGSDSGVKSVCAFLPSNTILAF